MVKNFVVLRFIPYLVFLDETRLEHSSKMVAVWLVFRCMFEIKDLVFSCFYLGDFNLT